MRARFVLGPAGSGKTCLCLEEIRRALLDDPEGPPLILLAPKQATFQLERQLLDSALPGYTRLHILSFERLAQFVFDKLRKPRGSLLSEEGRAMVFRALLSRRAAQLRIFHSNATLIGFARQLSEELRELQQLGLSPGALGKLASRADLSPSLRGKLQDLSLLLGDYLDWLDTHKVQDGAALFRLAAEALRESRIAGAGAPLVISHLWLDGFAEMTPQELTLLAELARCCEGMTLAFCIDAERRQSDDSWLSIWSGIKRARRHCAEALEPVPGVEFETIILPGKDGHSRFCRNPALGCLERNWDRTGEHAASIISPPRDAGAIRAAVCADFRSEAVLAAGEILRFVRAGQGRRFRDAAVLLRNLDGCHDELRRVFTQYQIPFFLDRRESVAHHPLAELTRNALRLLSRDWQHDDWFGALKTGLVCDDQESIDRLENEALARGWKGQAWKRPFAGLAPEASDAETLRAAWSGPFLQLTETLAAGEARSRPSGMELAAGLRQLWADLKVEITLEKWSGDTGSVSGPSGGSQANLHGAVWQQMNVWLDDVELAFGDERLALPDWLSILEAGLGGLSVGVIPPALDQVLIGSVDRSRNPDLKMALLLGANEGVFPAAAVQGRLLSEADRDQLIDCGVSAGLSARQFLSREHFLGYIACTRAKERLVITFSRQGGDGRTLNPSLFISHIQRLLPDLQIEDFAGPSATMPEHACEMIPMLAESLPLPAGAGAEWKELLTLPPLASILRGAASFERKQPRLTPELAGQLYGRALRTSVSALEKFAACPFQFFVHAGLKGEERKLFELEAREKGTFQHELVAAFHQQLQREGLRWRDLTPDDARARVAALSESLAPRFANGLLVSDTRSRFAARMMTASLQDCVATMVEWMGQYRFEPTAVELAFGGSAGLPAWELDLGSGHSLVFRGRIDRIDLCPSRNDPDAALAVVVDYKSSEQKLKAARMSHALQLQLPAYLSVLQQLNDPRKIFGVGRLIPAGVFYVNLRGRFDAVETRDEALQGPTEERQKAYKHFGRFDAEVLADLDNRGADKGTQFNFTKKKGGGFAKRPEDPMSREDFRHLLTAAEEHLRRIGTEVFAGKIDLDPYQDGKKRPCDWCQYQGVCRIDPWSHPFRVLSKRAGKHGKGLSQ